MDKIIVSALNSIEPRVAKTLHWDNIKNGNIIGQIFVEEKEEPVVQIPFYIRMKKILTGMHMRIGTPAAVDANFSFQQFGKCGLQNLLHSKPARMLLPAAVICAMITNVKEVAQLKMFWAKDTH